MIRIHWHDEESDGYTDILPSEWFTKDQKAVEHETIGPREGKGKGKAKCDVRLRDNFADLDYDAYPDFNTKHGNFLGVLRLFFSNRHRESIARVQWRYQGTDRFEEAAATVEHYDAEEISSLSSLQMKFDHGVREALQDTSATRRRRLKDASPKPKEIKVTVLAFVRNPDVVAEVLERAEGKCEDCRSPAPFRRRSDDTPYLEVHHQRPLAEGGDDTVENAIALCPNCHRKAHFGPV